MSSEAITRNDLTTILNTLLPLKPSVYSGAWTASSTSATNARVTDDVVLPAGIYVVTVSTPYTTGNDPLIVIKKNGVEDYTTLLSGRAGAYASRVVILELTEQTTVACYSAGSASTTYQALERGGLKAVRIA